MDKQSLLNLYSSEQRILYTHPGWTREESENVIRYISGESGLILYSKLTDDNVDSVIKDQLKHFKKIGKPFTWKWFDYDSPKSLKKKLVENGFIERKSVTLMVNSLHEENLLLQKNISSNIRYLSTEEEIDDIISLQNTIWNADFSLLGSRLKKNKVENPNLTHIYAMYVNDKPVSAAWMYLHAGTSFGSLWGGSTLPEFRECGFYTDLLAVRAKKAWEMGYSVLTVDATNMSKPILEKRGFQPLCVTIPFKSPIV